VPLVVGARVDLMPLSCAAHGALVWSALVPLGSWSALSPSSALALSRGSCRSRLMVGSCRSHPALVWRSCGAALGSFSLVVGSRAARAAHAALVARGAALSALGSCGCSRSLSCRSRLVWFRSWLMPLSALAQSCVALVALSRWIQKLEREPTVLVGSRSRSF
jgi:hypothetical protein